MKFIKTLRIGAIYGEGVFWVADLQGSILFGSQLCAILCIIHTWLSLTKWKELVFIEHTIQHKANYRAQVQFPCSCQFAKTIFLLFTKAKFLFVLARHQRGNAFYRANGEHSFVGMPIVDDKYMEKCLIAK